MLHTGRESSYPRCLMSRDLGLQLLEIMTSSGVRCMAARVPCMCVVCLLIKVHAVRAGHAKHHHIQRSDLVVRKGKLPHTSCLPATQMRVMA